MIKIERMNKSVPHYISINNLVLLRHRMCTFSYIYGTLMLLLYQNNRSLFVNTLCGKDNVLFLLTPYKNSYFLYKVHAFSVIAHMFNSHGSI